VKRKLKALEATQPKGGRREDSRENKNVVPMQKLLKRFEGGLYP